METAAPSVLAPAMREESPTMTVNSVKTLTTAPVEQQAAAGVESSPPEADALEVLARVRALVDPDPPEVREESAAGVESSSIDEGRDKPVAGEASAPLAKKGAKSPKSRSSTSRSRSKSTSKSKSGRSKSKSGRSRSRSRSRRAKEPSFSQKMMEAAGIITIEKKKKKKRSSSKGRSSSKSRSSSKTRSSSKGRSSSKTRSSSKGRSSSKTRSSSKGRSRSKSATRKSGERSRSKSATRNKADAVVNLGDGKVCVNGNTFKKAEKKPEEMTGDKKSKSDKKVSIKLGSFKGKKLSSPKLLKKKSSTKFASDGEGETAAASKTDAEVGLTETAPVADDERSVKSTKSILSVKSALSSKLNESSGEQAADRPCTPVEVEVEEIEVEPVEEVAVEVAVISIPDAVEAIPMSHIEDIASVKVQASTIERAPSPMEFITKTIQDAAEEVSNVLSCKPVPASDVPDTPSIAEIVAKGVKKIQDFADKVCKAIAGIPPMNEIDRSLAAMAFGPTPAEVKAEKPTEEKLDEETNIVELMNDVATEATHEAPVERAPSPIESIAESNQEAVDEVSSVVSCKAAPSSDASFTPSVAESVAKSVVDVLDDGPTPAEVKADGSEEEETSMEENF